MAVFGFLAANTFVVRAQSTLPAFDVASIRRSEAKGERAFISAIVRDPDGLRMRSVTLTDLMLYAYDVQSYQIEDFNKVNERLDNNHYDIIAKAGGRMSSAQLRLMLQQLLDDRFKFRFHRESRDLPVFDMTVAGRGPRLPMPRSDDGEHFIEMFPRIRDDIGFLFQDNSLAKFAEKLSQLRDIGRPVVDKTGIQGRFDLTLKMKLPPEEGSPSVFTLIEEQFGLKLVSARAMVQVLVVDHVERPSEN